MGLATPDEVPDMFVLHNLKQVSERWDALHGGEGDRDHGTDRRRDRAAEPAAGAGGIGFVYFLLPGQEPDPELLRELVRYRPGVGALAPRHRRAGPALDEIPGR